MSHSATRTAMQTKIPSKTGSTYSLYFTLLNPSDPKSHVRYCHHWVSVVIVHTFNIFTFLSETTGPIGTKLVGMLIGCSCKQSMVYFWLIRKTQMKQQAQRSKKGVSCFCMWSIYFSNNLDDLFSFLLIKDKELNRAKWDHTQMKSFCFKFDLHTVISIENYNIPV